MPGATIAADELRVGLLLTLLALSGVVVSEVAKDATLRRALLVGGTHMGILSGLVATTSLPGFRYSEPFQGGEQFILLQAHGWMILGAAGCLSLILMGSIEDVGVGVAGVGFASAIIFGDGVLFASLYYFQPGRRRRRLQSDGAKFLGDQTSILRKLPALLLALVAFVLLCTCESIRLSSRELGPTLLLAGCFAMVLSAVYTHIMLGGQMPGWRVFQPFRGGTEFVVLQAEGWMLLATVLNFGLVAGRQQTLEHIPRGIILFSSLLQIIANLLLLASLSLYNPNADWDMGGQQQAATRAPVRSAASAFDGNPVPRLSSGNRCSCDANSEATEKRPRRSFSKLVWGLGLVLAIVPPVMLWALRFTGMRGLHEAVGLTPNRLLLCMFLSAPLSHISGILEHKGYRFFQPLLGGFAFVTSQGFGWFLYGFGLAAVVVGSMNKFGANDLEHMIPLLFFAQACISVSTLYFRPGHLDPIDAGQAMQLRDDALVSMSDEMTAPMSNVFICICMCMIVLTYAAWSGRDSAADGEQDHAAVKIVRGESSERLGWFIIYALVSVTAAGFHLVWTHVWLIGTGAILLTKNATLLAASAMLGVNISVTWYLTLWRKRDLGVPDRAIAGWSYWICEELIGGLDDWQGNVSWRPIRSLLTGFLLTDLGLHLLPTLILLQLAAEHVTPLSVLLGYAATRLWSLAITSHHVAVDWLTLRRKHELRVRFLSQTPSAYVDGGIINYVYGFVPPAPSTFFHDCVVTEGLCALSTGILTILPVEPSTRTTIFLWMGLHPLFSTEFLVKLCTFFVVFGALTIGVGAVLAYSSRRRRGPSKEHLQLRTETAEGGLGVSGKLE